MAGAALAVALGPNVGISAAPHPRADASASALYVVLADAAPLASYAGGSPGFAATHPARGRKLDSRSSNARAYARHLVDSHDRVLRAAAVPPAAKRTDYTIAFNGFAANLTAAQADRLAGMPGVRAVWKDEVRAAATTTTPDFLGLSGAAGVWATKSGGVGNAGAGIIIGMLDSGIWPENPAFAALPAPRPDEALVDAKWHGTCVPGESGPVTCSDKIIGARYYTEGQTMIDAEFRSPRDYQGHGTHTASTAAGDNAIPAIVNGGFVGTTSGVAPAARIAAYKVLWAAPDGRATGSTAAIVHAVDHAVADGVDVLNYSVTGSTQSIVTPEEVAFLGAADAGVVVVTAAGNTGDEVGAGSVMHAAPWTTTVAAGTHDRSSANRVWLGDGTAYTGVGVSPVGAGPAPLALGRALALPAADPDLADLCFSSATNGGVPVLDPAKAAGRIVLCTRGQNSRLDKSRAVADAGGIGMILANPTDAAPLYPEFHTVPTSHVNATTGAAIRTYAASAASPTATIAPRDPTPLRAPAVADVSGIGPAGAGGGDLLKPDLLAPGVDIIAAVSPSGDSEHGDFAQMSGTSMATPHVSGLAALLLQAHPDWSPMWVKSALMTTATTTDNRGLPIQRAGRNATPLDIGAGHLAPAAAFDPGLVYASTATDWYRYGCAIGQLQQITSPAFCQRLAGFDPVNLNSPSIAVGALAGTRTITRTLINPSGDQASSYTARLVPPPGFTGSLTTSKFTLAPLATRTFSLTLTRTTAPLNQWAFGSLTWTDKRGHVVRSPIAIRPVVATIPGEISVTGASGTAALTMRPGYSGPLAAAVSGLVPARVDVVAATRTTDATVNVDIPAGTPVARFATFAADLPPGTDVDLRVTRAGALVGSSATGSADESVTLSGADLAGTYAVTVHYASGPTASVDVALDSFAVGAAPAGNLTASPATQSVTSGRAATVTLGWTGLTPGRRHLGAVSWTSGTTSLGRTLVAVAP